MSESGEPEDSGVRSWATRSAGVIGLFNAMLYLGLVIGQASPDDYLFAGVWFVVMVVAGLLAWFADRLPARLSRRTAIGALALFFLLGVMSIMAVGLLYLGGVVLCLIGLAPRVENEPAG